MDEVRDGCHGISSNDSLGRLARALYETMEYLDPNTGDSGWETLSEREREFYRLAVSGLLLERRDVLRVLHVDLADDRVVDRTGDVREQANVR